MSKVAIPRTISKIDYKPDIKWNWIYHIVHRIVPNNVVILLTGLTWHSMVLGPGWYGRLDGDGGGWRDAFA